MEREIYKQAQKKVKKKKGFYQHLAAFVAVNGFLFFINMFTDPGEIWFVFPMMSWGIGLAIHYLNVFGFPGSKVLGHDWEQQELEKEIQRLKSGLYNKDDDYIAPIDVEDELELKEFKKLRKEWDDTDFV